jgi:glycosidase
MADTLPAANREKTDNASKPLLVDVGKGLGLKPGNLDVSSACLELPSPVQSPRRRSPVGLSNAAPGTIEYWREYIGRVSEPLQSVKDVRGFLHLLRQVDRKSFPSPPAWEDEVLYFVLLDRFSDGNETGFLDNDGIEVPGSGTKRYRIGDCGGPRSNEYNTWLGGNLCGAAEKLGYLRRLGVTAVWVSPVFRQAANQHTYHGYAIQNFLDVDPHFAPEQLPFPWNNPREALRAFVTEAHQNNIRVILDIVINHTGDVFAYAPDRFPTKQRDSQGNPLMHPRWDGNSYQVRGFRNSRGDPLLAFGSRHKDAWPDGAVWPIELQDHGTFTCQGEISNWDHWPEFIDGDFFNLKNIRTAEGGADARAQINHFRPTPAFLAITDVYKYWMAYADVDGFRIDTVKHIEKGAMRFFAKEIHEFAQAIGKENFYLIGEVTGGRREAFATVEQTGIDAALGIADLPRLLHDTIRGTVEPQEYFRLFRNAERFGKESQAWFNSRVVTMYDDHDMVGREKRRLCSHYDTREQRERAAFRALAMTVTTMGIPCIYYGSEQCFDGADPDGHRSDAFIREAMFGGGFGSLGCHDRHFFDETCRVYRKLSQLLRLRSRLITLRRGRQYLREISGDGSNFGLPTGYGRAIRSIIAWSRIFAHTEILLAVNTDLDEDRTAWVTVDGTLYEERDSFECIFDYDEEEVVPRRQVTSVERRNGNSVKLSVPRGGFVMYLRSVWVPKKLCI